MIETRVCPTCKGSGRVPGKARNKVSSFAERARWLRDHADLWAHPRHPDDRWRMDIVSAMKRDGLLSASTYYKDVNLDGLIERIERLEREKS